MNILFIQYFLVVFMVSEIPRVSVFGYFPLIPYLCLFRDSWLHSSDTSTISQFPYYLYTYI